MNEGDIEISVIPTKLSMPGQAEFGIEINIDLKVL
jgi:hypothetical protein